MTKYQTGDILFVDKRTFILSWVIRKVAKIEFSHVETIILIDDYPYAIGARGGKICPIPIEEITSKYRCEVHRPPYKISDKVYTRKAMLKSGVASYDTLGLTLHQFVWNVFGNWIGARTAEQAEKKFYCYEFMSYMLNEIEWWMVRPKLLYQRYLKYKI